MELGTERIKELFFEIKEKEKKRKDLNKAIKDAYANFKEYQDLQDEMNKLRARRKEVEGTVRQQYASEFNDLEDVKLDIKETKQVLSDLMWGELMKNHPVEVTDEYNNKLVPFVSVVLKKDE